MFTLEALDHLTPPKSIGPRSSDAFPAFTPWLKQVSPELHWDFPHLVFLRRHLADVTLGRTNQLAINIPSQFGKSQLITIRYALWRLMRDPTLRIAVTAHSQKLANKFSRAARRLAVEQGLALGDVQMADEWETAAGGSFIAKGRGAGIVGQPVDLLVIDDPYRDARDAASPTIRETVWEWWTDALSKRLSARGQVICVHTRWRTDDLTGRFLAQGGWSHVCLTALAEAGDPLGRADGESLCEALHPRTQLEQQRRENPRSFAGLGQQRPIDQEGNLFKPERIAIQTALPANLTRVVRFFDLAATKDKVGADPDYTVGAKMGRDADGRCYVLDLVRGRFSPLEVKQAIVNTAAMDGKGVSVFIEQEGARAACTRWTTWSERWRATRPGASARTVRRRSGPSRSPATWRRATWCSWRPRGTRRRSRNCWGSRQGSLTTSSMQCREPSNSSLAASNRLLRWSSAGGWYRAGDGRQQRVGV